MTAALLDVNVLLALLDSDHVDHRLAHDWLDRGLDGAWASCPITENGFVRIISQPHYPSPISVRQAIDLLRAACESVEHERWPCDLSVLDPAAVDGSRIHGPKQVTDAYLLAMAVQRGARFVTFDRSVPLSAVRGATADHLVVL